MVFNFISLYGAYYRIGSSFGTDTLFMHCYNIIYALTKYREGS
ncbi:hypothetical protein YPPY34_4566 [Yersinia pestis PY-34]|nr:hypothetical protein YPPY34_4566 [Yersinia pestis PY-34]EIS38733.1 hypothetical protein YPPY60_4565 [Yersinia pestis PY-60]EIS39262.1 hypothetical protein YPPY59_4635 [Yersinia pestis PY-59]